jgi:UDP-N-acetylmuramoylalanine--D-glutamate ligase
MNKILNQYENKRILILGFGREGQSTFNFLQKHFKTQEIGVADRNKSLKDNDLVKTNKNKITNLSLGSSYLRYLADYDLVFRSPGISPNLEEIKVAKEKGVKFTSQTKLFFELKKGTVVGVTGTKGKSTTSSLIYHILMKSGIKTEIIGNIGKPPLDYLKSDSPDTIFVYELSSHQLYDLEKSPHVAVFLNFYEEHLDYYKNINEYFNAKTNIAIHQTKNDHFIFNPQFNRIKSLASKLKSHVHLFSLENNSKAECILDGDTIKLNDKKVINTKDIPLTGKHNITNAMAAILVTKSIGLNIKDISISIKSFHPLEGRLEPVGVIGNAYFVNDTLATVPEATIAALETFKGKKVTLILGGYERDLDYRNLCSEIVKNKEIVSIITIGSTASRIHKLLKDRNYGGNLLNLDDSSMDEIVRSAYDNTEKNGIVLLSPAAASFDMFKNYEDRGNNLKKQYPILERVDYE